ncbi:MAG: GNAT family N-acetyltransferase [Geitlerinemataceae cyanobacterium]
MLFSFAHRAYREVDSVRTGNRLSQTLDRYLSARTPIWWIEADAPSSGASSEGKSPPDAGSGLGARSGDRAAAERRSGLPYLSSGEPTGQLQNFQPIACLWLGSATTPSDAEPQAYVLLLYVAPEHRRRGLATHLLHLAEAEAERRGDRQLGLQVQAGNTAAIALYEKLGYFTLSRWMGKPLG